MSVLYKVQCFIRISDTNTTDNLTCEDTCEIIYDNFTCENFAFQTITFYIGGKPVVYIINRKIHGCLEIPDLFLVLNMMFLTRSPCAHSSDILFNTRNKSGISAHPCIILYINFSRTHNLLDLRYSLAKCWRACESPLSQAHSHLSARR